MESEILFHEEEYYKARFQAFLFFLSNFIYAFLPYSFVTIVDSTKRGFGCTDWEIYLTNQAGVIMIIPATFVSNYVL